MDAPVLSSQETIDVPNLLHFIRWTRHQDHSVSGDAFALTKCQLLLRFSARRDEHSSQPITRHSSLLETKFCEPLLSSQHFYSELSTVFTRHASFQRLHDGGRRASVVH